MNVIDDFKECRSCSISKPLHAFYWRGGKETNPRASCKQCIADKNCARELIQGGLRRRIYIRDSFTCYLCCKDLFGETLSGISLDHVVPKSKGGRNIAANLITCCKSCNSTKGTSDSTDTAKILFLIKKRNIEFDIDPKEKVWFKAA